jgi:hypothetical protein
VSPLVSLCRAFLIEEDSGREARRVFFRSKPQTPNFRVEVEKQGASLFLLFLLFDFDGTTSSVPLVSLCRAFLIEEDS